LPTSDRAHQQWRRTQWLQTDAVMWLRMNEADPEKGRMPQIASHVIDHEAVAIVGDWIKSIATCP
jgi:hypothetical protein